MPESTHWSDAARPVVTCAPRDRWSALRRTWRDDSQAVFACTHRAEVYLFEHPDDLRARPSPASSLAAYEVAERVDRIEVRHLLCAPAAGVSRAASVAEVAESLAAGGLRPLLVAGGAAPAALTAEAFLRWLARSQPPAVGGS